MPIDHSAIRLDFGQGHSDKDVYDKAAAIRTQVFQVEQGYKNEFEQRDGDAAIHFIAEVPASVAAQLDSNLHGGGEYQAVAAGRIYQLLYKAEEGKPNSPAYPLEMVFSLGRICCLKPFRGQGLGHLILEKMVSTAKRLGANRLVLNAQADKVGFYARSGFTAIQQDGKDWCFEDEGNPHVGMQLLCDSE
ncbi:hypothetical protein ABBQ38_011537 [Trebouxia sp. C0009 RCD-2024]